MTRLLASRLGHGLLKTFIKRGLQRFEREAPKLESIQRGMLQKWLHSYTRSSSGKHSPLKADDDWEQFGSKQPCTTYDSYRDAIERQRNLQSLHLFDSPINRYQPTSGSTSAIKWIPYTQAFLGELDRAITPWIGDLYRQFPNIAQGSHYWSLSWIPTSLRDASSSELNDDMQLMSLSKRLIAGLTQTAPTSIALAKTADDSLFATLAYLAADEHLSVISIWSPTFGLGLLEQLSICREELAEVLERGSWGDRMGAMGSLNCPQSRKTAQRLKAWDGVADPAFFAALWPHLALLSAWDTAAAAPWAQRLKRMLAHAQFQGKGLWATEGVVSIPVQGHYPLAYRSHVYEFEDLENGRILAPWQLRKGQQVMPLLTTGSGFARYRMNDVLEVSHHWRTLPCFTFLGRNDGTDMVGEKISATLAQTIIDSLTYCDLLPITLLALSDSGAGKPGYALLIEGQADATSVPITTLASQLEHALLDNFHYRLARDLGQLAQARCISLPNMRQIYLEQSRVRGMLEGNIKLEALRHWSGPLPIELRQALQATQ
ncbi:GH3 auxin-responsive promoter family protein [Pseudomonas sp. M30-35]|uniref:GH3 family domain-containing protein n=1 Tax=Pseudomonas sp. M30-35 TaxID=1981174 RepID=UPI0021151080|nr:GH3 auxin-responsive promoter family protein [Pseudomonas sp. M30-35]